MTKNTESRLICIVADIIERLSERNQDLLLFKYQHNCSDDLIADLMAIPEKKVEAAINDVKLLIAASLLLENRRPMGEAILKCAVTIVMQRQMNNTPVIEDTSEENETKPFDVFMQELEERHERRMGEKKENR